MGESTTNNTTDSKQGEALACSLCGNPLTILPNESAYCHNLKPNPSSYDDWQANSCPMAQQSTCLPVVVWKALNARRASLAAVEGDGESDYDYAVRLARHLMANRFPVEGWQPLPTLSGVLSQIDNMIAGLTKPKLTMRDLALRHTEQGLPAAASSPLPAEPPNTEGEQSNE